MNAKLKKIFKEYYALMAKYKETGLEKHKNLAYRRVLKIIAASRHK